ncbi:MAG: amino acid dehydrogenase [Natronospirillum sp.]|uniref:Leu/Phe/Val dehydrogenase n=1 Tax=Natronospirillum sp. TaxID=2812955 RepID=UPI0025F77751|nr:Glu/Leu/Phe/Val dehydrogenase [Natronospirillum sp.]MCH8552610.1 amino acid dehydrogenase [Natronospirillum sp.]
MSVFSHPEFDHHEHLSFVHDEASGLRAIMAVHNTRLGHALGGTRFYPYATDEEAIRDVLRLSRGMTYKSAMARLPLGGGKSVIIGDPRKDKTKELLHAFGRGLNALGGRYIAAEDSGTTSEDMKCIHQVTEYVTGYHDKVDFEGRTHSGEPSPATAYGCYMAIRAAVEHHLGKDSLNGLTVGIQGMGSVGYRLGRLLVGGGARLIVADVNESVLAEARQELDAEVVSTEDIYDQPMDVFSPCALGATINQETLQRLQASIIAGAANNQLDRPETGQVLFDRGICYAPDYVVNAGGVIDVYYEQSGQYDPERVQRHVGGIHSTLTEIFERSQREKKPTSEIADTIARERLR